MTIADEWALYNKTIENEGISDKAMQVLRMAFYSGFSAALTLWEQSRGGRQALTDLEVEFLSVDFADLKVVGFPTDHLKQVVLNGDSNG